MTIGMLFDLRPLKQAISKKRLKVEDLTLERIIKGYDYLVYIPTLTKAQNRGKKIIKIRVRACFLCL